MTKQEILRHFKDINTMYNESTRYDDLSRMLDELIEDYSDRNLRIRLENAEDVLRGLKEDLSAAREELRERW